MKHKIVTVSELQEKLNLHRKNKKICLITGCFEIFHIRHYGLIQFAKKHCEIIVVGLESDKSISLNKNRDPFSNQEGRLKTIANLELVNYIFPIKWTLSYDSDEINIKHQDLINKLKPNYLATCVNTDNYWEIKQKRIESIGGKLLKHRTSLPVHSSDFIKTTTRNSTKTLR